MTHQTKKTLKIIAVGLISISLFFTIKAFLAQEVKRKKVAEEIKNLQEQAASLDQKNKQLSDSLAFLDTNAYKEKVAKESLNMKQDGEVAISFIPEVDNGNNQPKNDQKPVSNPLKWWYYFFSRDNE
jgi:cell division protein FtsB